jgi:hypothetical protein
MFYDSKIQHNCIMIQPFKLFFSFQTPPFIYRSNDMLSYFYQENNICEFRKYLLGKSLLR